MFLRKHIALRIFRWSKPRFLGEYIALRFIRWPEPVFLKEHTALVGTSVSDKAHGVGFLVVRNSVSK